MEKDRKVGKENKKDKGEVELMGERRGQRGRVER